MQLDIKVSPYAKLQTWLAVLIQGGLGGYFAVIIFSGRLANYINARFVWLSYVAVVLLGLMTTFSILRAVRGQGEQSAYRISNPQSLTWSVLVVTAIPLVLGMMVPSTPLGVEAVNGNISTRAVLGTNEASAFVIEPAKRNVLDWLRMFGEADDYATFNGQPVDVIGFVYREPTYGENQFMVARFTMSCCVADASAIALPVVYDGMGELTEGQWVRVRGTMQVADFLGEDVPTIQNVSVEFVEQPEFPYLYP